jgi:hypothetical protein
MQSLNEGLYPPIIVTRNNIVDPQLLANLFNTKMQDIGIELLSSHGGLNRSWKTHQACCLVVVGSPPSVAPLADTRALGIDICRQLESIASEE